MDEVNTKQGNGISHDGPAGGPPPGVGGPAGGPPPGYDGPPPGVDNSSGALNMPAFAIAFSRDFAPRRPDLAAIWFMDIRNFRSINPKFGYSKGNDVLKCVANSVREILVHDNPIARLGADRFVFVTDGLDYEQAQEKFQALAEKVDDGLRALGMNAHLSLIAGMYYLTENDFYMGNHSRAMDYASIAHRNARQETRSTVLMFTEEDLERDNRRITIEQSIDHALESRQIEVWYQPQIDYTFGEVVGAEALARWNHPELGWISPVEFIPILEDCGKIHELDLFVWEEACRNAGRWRSVSDGKPVPISVNVSRTEMFEDGLMEHFLELQKKYDLPNGSLHLEITESAFVEEADRLYSVIENLRKNNMLVEMDDFGNGLSSLNMLKDVPVDVVKLDMGFMRSAVSEDRGGVVLNSVIRMLQGLETPIIAEGVETLEQAEMLKNMGCHLMQGFHFSRPMPLEDFESYIASNNTDESSLKRTRRESRLDELTSFDPASSFIFNNVIGGTMFFVVKDGLSESILVNDEFYEACGLKREEFGNSRIEPMDELAEESHPTMWRAADESREFGAALCRAQVKKTGRWIDCVMRFLGESARGNVFSLNIYRWGMLEGETRNANEQLRQDSTWLQSILDKIAPSGFLKFAATDDMSIDFTSVDFMKNTGLSYDEFLRRHHNSFLEFVSAVDRPMFIDAVMEGTQSGSLINCELSVHYGFAAERGVHLFGRVEHDSDDKPWCFAFVVFKALVESVNGSTGPASHMERIIPFDYYLADDRLVVHDIRPDSTNHEIEIANWLELLDTLPDNISKSSATKILATMRDLRHHPTSGFTDLKCNLSGRGSMRWYHINYSCDSDEDGNTTVVHGYAQNADDQMGSAKWWRRQAEIDQLTGLLNRNAVEQDINMSMRTQGLGMMFMMDLDAFKRVNDELGHLTGDALLRDVANTLAERFRESDVLGRYGGDEFVAFVPVALGDPHNIAERRCREIIDSISRIEIPDGTHAGCSIGVAISSNREATFYDLLEVADQAMYRSKIGGKGTFTIIDMA